MIEKNGGLPALELELELIAAQRLFDDGNINRELYERIMREILREAEDVRRSGHEDNSGERSTAEG